MDENIKISKVKKTAVAPWFIIGVIVGAAAIFAWNVYMPKTPTEPSTQVQQAQVQAIIAKVGKLIILPTGEDPVVATISDASTLMKEQAFYKGSENGDIVLVYQKAAKAIVYSPSRNLIVNVGPVVLQNPQTTVAATSTTTSTATTTKKK